MLGKNNVVQIFPCWIHTFDQFVFSFSIPTFYLFFSLDCSFDIIGFFKIHQFMNFVFCSETVRVQIMFVFIYTSQQIIRYTGIDCNISNIGQNINIIIHNDIICQNTDCHTPFRGFAMRERNGLPRLLRSLAMTGSLVRTADLRLSLRGRSIATDVAIRTLCRHYFQKQTS